MIDYKTILNNIQKQIEDSEKKIETSDTGVVIEFFDGVAKAVGLDCSKLYDIVVTKENKKGMIMKIDAEFVFIIFFEKFSVYEGLQVFNTHEKLKIKFDDRLLGKVINPLGEILLDKVDLNITYEQEVYVNSPSITQRKMVNESLFTGISLIDILIPIGLGQKQLILGDKQTGKTSICLDVIINQAKLKQENKQFAYCIYVAIGKKASEIARIYDVLKKNNALEHSIIVATTSSDSSAMQYIAPEVGTAIAEYFSNLNKHALVIFDDLTKHADVYREISLLMRKMPARGAYPGDIFYLHAKLLERAAKLKTEGSVTMLPIIETLEGDISDYIPTNVISITDGQIYMDKHLFLNNQKPAINIGLSVSRIGSAAQHTNTKELAGNLKGQLAQFAEYESFSKSVTDLDDLTKKILSQGKMFMNFFKQKNFQPKSKAFILLNLFAIVHNLIDENINLQKFQEELYEYTKANRLDLFMHFENNESIKPHVEVIKNFIKDFVLNKYKN